MNGSPIRPRVAACAALLFAGCAIAPVTVTYQPTTPARPLQSARKPKIFLDNVEDRTEGVAVSSTRQGHLLVPFTAPFSETLRQALSVEFSRLEVPLVETAEQADAILHVKATEADADGGTLSLSMTLSGRDGRLFWSKRYKGRSRTGGSNNSVMNGALSDAMSRIGALFETEKVASLIFSGRDSGSPALDPDREPRSDIDDLIAGRSRPRPNAHAVVIGVGNYRQQLPEAEFADSDARLVSKYLTQALGYQDENVATLVNEHASKSDFEKYFERWLPNRVEKGDEVFVYYSGYGAPNPATAEPYLVPYDGDPAYLKQTGYPLARMFAALAKLPARKITVVMDSGFSGAGGRSVLAKGAKPLVNVVLGEDLPANVIVLSASAGDQAALNYREKGHGLFTYFFLKGIKEKTDKGDVDMKAVFDYAATQVSRIARKEDNVDQVPQWRETKP